MFRCSFDDFRQFQLKKLLRESQRDYERKTADHSVSVRELQTSLSAERNKFETLEHQVKTHRSTLFDRHRSLSSLVRRMSSESVNT